MLGLGNYSRIENVLIRNIYLSIYLSIYLYIYIYNELLVISSICQDWNVRPDVSNVRPILN